MDRKMDAVMKERVAALTCTGYDGRNILFMIWLFDGGEKYSHLFESSIYPKMEEAHANDKKRKTKSGRARKKRDYLRATCLEALTSINPADAGTIPIKLEILDFTIFTRFLSTFKKKVKKRNMQGNVVVEGDDHNTIRLSPSSFGGACSALAHLFTESGVSKEKTQ